jgi:hypothetical protein
MQAIDDIFCRRWLPQRHEDRLDRLQDHCEAELAVLNAELGL